MVAVVSIVEVSVGAAVDVGIAVLLGTGFVFVIFFVGTEVSVGLGVERSIPLASKVRATMVGRYSVGNGVSTTDCGIISQLLDRPRANIRIKMIYFL
jgi:hypothetical protein